MLEYCLKKACMIPKTHRYRLYACVLDKQGNILGEGKNEYLKSHPVQAKYAKIVNRPNAIYLHAECNAIVKALKHGKPYSIWIARAMSNNQSASAKPCDICQLLIKKSDIRQIHYTV